MAGTASKAAAGPVDLLLLQDLSGSFSDDLSILKNSGQPLIDALRTNSADARFGVASFIDKPVEPFGSDGDYVYRLDRSLTTNGAAVTTALNSLEVGYGNDGPESQVEALLQVGLRSTEVGYRASAQKYVLVSTDADYHVAGDFPSQPDNDGDRILDGSPPGTGEDYPTIAQAKTALQSAGITPIFAVTSSEKATYQDLASQLGRGDVITLTSDSENLVDAVRQSIAKLTGAADYIGTDGNNSFSGGSGSEAIFGGLGFDTLSGNGGSDTVDGGGDGDRVSGGDNADIVRGGSGDDVVHGDAGDDRLEPGSGLDMMTGGAGVDRYIGSSDELNGDTIADLRGGEAIVITDKLFANSDIRYDSTLYRLFIDGDGDDDEEIVINLDSGAIGSFTAVSAAGGTEVRLGTGGIAPPTEGNDTINGTAGPDTIDALGGDDLVNGNGGDDTVGGNYGNDTIYGNAGNDRVNGSYGDDFVYGGDGNDNVRGGPGFDQLYGGAGQDDFDFDLVTDSVVGSRRDVIYTFQRGPDDIDITGIGTGKAGQAAFKFVDTKAFTAAGQVRETVINGDTVVQGNTDADRTPEFEIGLDGRFNLAASDFAL